MAKNSEREYRNPNLIASLLHTALLFEDAKYDQCGVTEDFDTNLKRAQEWGYAVPGYFLLEQALKGLLHVRGKDVPKKHSLLTLFGGLCDDFRSGLGDYYAHYQQSADHSEATVQFPTVDAFLRNLDGEEGGNGRSVGSLYWRYYLYEETRGIQIPVANIDYMHALVLRCVYIMQYENRVVFFASPPQFGWEKVRKRQRDYFSYVLDSTFLVDLKDSTNRTLILWGPDRLGRYDVVQCQEGQWKLHFWQLPLVDPKLHFPDRRPTVKRLVAAGRARDKKTSIF